MPLTAKNDQARVSILTFQKFCVEIGLASNQFEAQFLQHEARDSGSSQSILLNDSKVFWLCICKCEGAMPANLNGLAKHWYHDEDLRARSQTSGLLAMVLKQVRGQALARRDKWHAIHNREFVKPIIVMMRDQHLLKTPYLKDLDLQVAIFSLMINGKPVHQEHIEYALADNEVEIHLNSSSIKKILGFLRKKYLAPHTPRDMGFENGCVMLRVFLLKL